MRCVYQTFMINIIHQPSTVKPVLRDNSRGSSESGILRQVVSERREYTSLHFEVFIYQFESKA